MPIYEYRCRKCGHEFDLLVRSAADERKAACPGCQGHQVEKRLSTFAARVAGNAGCGAGPASDACQQCCSANAGCPMRGQ